MNEETEKHGGGRGRPKTERPLKNIQCKGWIGPIEQEMMDEMVRGSDKNKSELLRIMIRTYYYGFSGKW